MKPGVRAVGIAESFTGDRSTLAAVVTRASRVVDGLAFGSCTVGGTDATDGVIDLVEALDREDVHYLLIAGIAPAWFNIVDLPTIHRRFDLPAVSISFEASPGLEPAIHREFSADAAGDRLARYRRQPERIQLTVNEHELFVRTVGLDDDETDTVIHAFTPEGGRPEPLRVARLAARAADRWRGI